MTIGRIQVTRKYEFVALFQAGEDALKNGKDAVATEFGNAKISVLNEQDMGEKILGYEIADQDRGHYYFYEIETEPNSINPISRILKLKPEIMKFLFVKK